MKGTLASHSNFRDPTGLLLRMLRSGDRAARAALLRAASTVLLAPLDNLLVPLESHRVRAARPSSLPILLIVGAPRSGTTLVYQILARYLPVTYFTNLSALFPRAPLTASRLFRRWLSTPRTDFHSYYGNTAGLAAPNDGFHVWNRWLGADRYRTPQELDSTSVAEMRQFFAAWREAFDRPLLNKNNRNADCVALLGTIFPEAVFLDVRRDPIYVAQSLLIAREQIQGSKALGWGLASRDQDSRRGLFSYIDDVCDQVFSIERKLDEDKQRLGRERFIEIVYEDFCSDPSLVLRQVSDRALGVPIDPDSVRLELRPLKTTNEMRLPTSEFERIQGRITELYGSSLASSY